MYTFEMILGATSCLLPPACFGLILGAASCLLPAARWLLAALHWNIFWKRLFGYTFCVILVGCLRVRVIMWGIIRSRGAMHMWLPDVVGREIWDRVVFIIL